ncbi:MAG TPA: lysylphosphatidylglycerol synthase transmembrane domain-containing protein, partial [Chitinophagaceae bacterium]
RHALSQANYWLLLPVFVVLLLAHFFRALRWKQLIAPMGYDPPVFFLTCGVLIGYIGNQLIPRAGEVLRCTSISKPTKVPPEKLIGTIVAERAFDISCLLVITIGVFYHEWNYISAYAHEIGSALREGIHARKGKGWIALITAALIVLIYLLYRRYKTHHVGGFLVKVFKGLAQGLTSIRNVKHKFLFLVYTVCIWICYAAATYLGCLALRETADLGIFAALSLLVFGTFGIIVAPGGLGAYPIAIQRTLVLYGVTEIIGLASGWILWIAQFIFVIFFGALAWLAVNIAKKRMDAALIVHTVPDQNTGGTETGNSRP